MLIMCCLISVLKVFKWLAHDFECFRNVKGVAQDGFLHSSEYLSAPIWAHLPFTIYHLLLSFELYILKDYKPAYSRANLGGLYYLQLYLPCKKWI